MGTNTEVVLMLDRLKERIFLYNLINGSLVLDDGIAGS